MYFTCSSRKKTTLGDGFHCRLCTELSSLERSSKLANSSVSLLALPLCRAFWTCLWSLGMSADCSQCSIPPIPCKTSSKILEGPLRPDTAWQSFLIVDRAVGINAFPDREFLCRLIWCSSPLKVYWYSVPVRISLQCFFPSFQLLQCKCNNSL